MSGYQEAGQLGYLEDAVKWGTDYIIKAHVEDHVFYCQVRFTKHGSRTIYCYSYGNILELSELNTFKGWEWGD